MSVCVFTDQINEHAMGGACSMHGEVRNACKIFVGSLKASAHFRSLGVSGTIRELWFGQKRGRGFFIQHRVLSGSGVHQSSYTVGQWVPWALSLGESDRGMRLTIHLHIVPK
jgi:hypothetical protein